jgi:MoxR-like ATPase
MLFYRGSQQPRADTTDLDLPTPISTRHEDPSKYRPDPGLTAALNVALLLGQPLLLTGDPGTGKTTFARAVSYELNLGDPLEVNVKSTTSGTDLLYRFDELALFRDNQGGRTPHPLAWYLHWRGLGEAIIRAAGADAPLYDLQGRELLGTEDTVREAFGPLRDGAPRCGHLLPGLVGSSRSSVVLVDELDKAPRDTPNDLLREIEELAFDIPELGIRVKLDAPAKRRRPIVIITSNSEKSLPEAFLRRCAYYHIPFPTGGPLQDIVKARVGAIANNPQLLKEALDLFDSFKARFQKPPGTAELLAWLSLLTDDEELKGGGTIKRSPDVAFRYLPAIAKTPEDRAAAKSEIEAWLQPKPA